MKNVKTLLLALTVVLMLVGIALPSWAYKCTVTNEFSQEDGSAYVTVQYTPIQPHDFNGGYGIGPGQTMTYSNDDWQNKGLSLHRPK